MTILTPSDEAFILLLIIVYFEDYSDKDYADSYARIHFVLRLGWKEAGIHLLDKLYQGVKKIKLNMVNFSLEIL